MNRNTKIILFIILGVIIIALVTYGYIASRKLDKQKIEKVDSNIDQFVYNEAGDTLDEETPEEEDLDGDEVTDEDSDFEVYEEDNGWDDADETEPETLNEPKPATKKEEEGLEELYDPNKEKRKKIIQTKKPRQPIKKASDTPSNDIIPEEKYLVVVGSFKSKSNARRKLKTLEAAGFDGIIMQLKDSDLQSVVAGRFKTEAAAESFARELIDEHDVKAIVKKD